MQQHSFTVFNNFFSVYNMLKFPLLLPMEGYLHQLHLMSHSSITFPALLKTSPLVSQQFELLPKIKSCLIE